MSTVKPAPETEEGLPLTFLAILLAVALGLGYLFSNVMQGRHAEQERYQQAFEDQCTDFGNRLNAERNICYSKQFKDSDGEWHSYIVSIKSLDETWTDPETEYGGGQ